MWHWWDAMQGAFSAAVGALQGAGNAAARRPKSYDDDLYNYDKRRRQTIDGILQPGRRIITQLFAKKYFICCKL
jgi:hypothetical protein